MDEELIFKALADGHRRTLLDLLFARDGRTLSDLESHLPMTRFGTMKHLQVLEDAGMIVTRKIGREKLHYLNPVPIQAVYERWVSKYAQPWTRALTALQHTLEEKPVMPDRPAHIFQIFVRATPEKVWEALLDGRLTPQYYFNCRVESDWSIGAAYRYIDPDGAVLLQGEITAIDPPRRLGMTFDPRYMENYAALSLSSVVWEIVPEGMLCKITVTHYDLDAAHPAASGIMEGWSRILSGLKTLLETGMPLTAG